MFATLLFKIIGKYFCTKYPIHFHLCHFSKCILLHRCFLLHLNRTVLTFLGVIDSPFASHIESTFKCFFLQKTKPSSTSMFPVSFLCTFHITNLNLTQIKVPTTILFSQKKVKSTFYLLRLVYIGKSCGENATSSGWYYLPCLAWALQQKREFNSIYFIFQIMYNNHN